MRRLSFALGMLLVLHASVARANGRFPASSAVVLVPDAPDFIVARVTFGLLVSADRGRTWGWVCERAVGFMGSEDPTYVARADGSIAAGTFAGVHVSNDHGCSWSATPGFEKEVTVDLAATSGGGFLALSSVYDHQSDAGEYFFRTVVHETHDFGQTFTAVGPPIDPSLLAYTVEAAPSDPSRIYVSAAKRNGAHGHEGFLFRSSDRGKTFVRNALSLVEGERSPYIAAVDAHDARRVYVRTAGGPDTPSRLLVSDDAAKTFRTVFTAKGPLAGFALAPDGSRAWIGGPVDGLLVAKTSDFAFTKTSSVEVQCLAASADEVWVCSNEKSGFFLATTKDDGAHFDVKLHLQELAGMLACAPTTTTARECPAEWPSVRRTLGITEAPDRSAPPAVEPAKPAMERWTWPVVSAVAVAVAVAIAAVVWLRRRLLR